MKKTFLMQFEYFDDRNGITESFGTNPQEMTDLALRAMRVYHEGHFNKDTALLLEMLESGQITGGQLMSLATLALGHVVLDAQTADPSSLSNTVLNLLKRMLEGRGEEEL